VKENAMVRHVLLGLAAAALVATSFVPDDAFARAARGGGARVGAVGGRAHVAHPIAGRGVAYRGGVYRGARVGVGAAAVGAAAVGAGYYYNNNYNGCYRDAYGQMICPNGSQYGY
jgi:hypothetical protein